MQWLDKWVRRALIRRLEHITPGRLRQLSERNAIGAFQWAARHCPAYAQFLQEQRCSAKSIDSLSRFHSQVPIARKRDLFGGFPLRRLSTADSFSDYASVVTSSGQGGSFAFGFTRRTDARRTRRLIDLGLEMAFGTDRLPTLLINALPMGVTFESDAVTIANTSVREDMVVALLSALSGEYAQTIILSDPLFFKRLLDFAADRKLEWHRHRVHVILGEETFSESYRTYVARHLGIDLDDPAGAMIGSSLGVAELGLNLFFETRESIALRRLASRNGQCFRNLLGLEAGQSPLPMLFAYNPVRTYVEIIGADSDSGFGDVVITMLGRSGIPLVRYATGDQGRFVAPDATETWLRQTPFPHGRGRLPIIAVAGRDSDWVTHRLHLAQLKELLYRDLEVAACITGAFQAIVEHGKTLLRVQLRRGFEPDPDLASRLEKMREEVLGATGSGVEIEMRAFADFPAELQLDYQRKFNYRAA